MKKSLIALAIAGLSFNAAAVTFGTDGKVVVNSVPFYAAELKMPVVLKTGTVKLDVVYPVKKAVAKDGKSFLRFDLTNAAFSADVKGTDATLTKANFAVVQAKANFAVVQGGKTTEKFVIIELTATDTIAADAAVTLALGTVQATGGDASVKVSQFDQLLDAVAGTGIVDSKSGNLFELKKLTVAADKGSDATAKAAEEFKLFTNKSKDAALGSLKAGYYEADGVTALVNTVYGRDGLAASMFDAKSVVTVTGDFSAVAKDKDGKLDATKVTLGTLKLTKLEANKATFEGVPVAAATANFALTVDGVTPIVSQSFVAGFAPVGW